MPISTIYFLCSFCWFSSSADRDYNNFSITNDVANKWFKFHVKNLNVVLAIVFLTKKCFKYAVVISNSGQTLHSTLKQLAVTMERFKASWKQS